MKRLLACMILAGVTLNMPKNILNEDTLELNQEQKNKIEIKQIKEYSHDLDSSNKLMIMKLDTLKKLVNK